MDTGLRFAAIDIGSNAIRLLFARIIENGNNKPFLIKESLIRMPLRLGQDVFIDGEISAINSEKFLKTMKGLKISSMHMSQLVIKHVQPQPCVMQKMGKIL